MSDKRKDYDGSVLRFAGNLISGQKDWPTWTDSDVEKRIERALYIARRARKELKKEQE